MVLLLTIVLSACGNAQPQQPERTLAQAGEALDQLSGYHVVVQFPGGQARIELDVRTPGGARGTLLLGSTEGQVRYDGETLFGQGQAFAEAYYVNSLSQGRPLTPDQVRRVRAAVDRMIGEGWFRDTLGPDGSFALATNPAMIATCLSSGHGRLSDRGTSSLGGLDVARIVDSGNASVAARSYAIASTGTPYPVQITQTGGVASDLCHIGPGVTMTFSKFGEHVFVDLPPHPFDPTGS